VSARRKSPPPSSDSPFTKPAPRSLRRKSGRKPGGQPRHPGTTLALVDKPDERLRHEPGLGSGCGADLAQAPEVGVERRQVFDFATDNGAGHRASAHCAPLWLWDRHVRYRAGGCDGASAARAADHSDHPLFVCGGQFLSKKRTAQALAELFGTPSPKASWPP
jgi:transposase